MKIKPGGQPKRYPPGGLLASEYHVQCTQSTLVASSTLWLPLLPHWSVWIQVIQKDTIEAFECCIQTAGFAS